MLPEWVLYRGDKVIVKHPKLPIAWNTRKG